jgi:tyrosine-protein kinase Etk/Wzc
MIPTEPTAAAVPEATTAPASSDYAGLDLLILLARRKRFVLRFTAAGAVLAIIVALLLPNKYTATAIVMPPVDNSLSSALLGQLGSSMLAAYAGSAFGVRNSAQVYTALVRSETVEDAMIRRFGLQAEYHKKTILETRLALEKRSSVVLGSRDGLIRISVEDRDPKRAAAMANAFVDELRKLSEKLAVSEASQRRLFFQQQLVQAKDKLAAAEEAMKKTEQTTGVLQIDSQAKSLIETAATLRAQVVAKQVQIQAMRAYATEDNPELVLVKQQLAALQAQLDKLGGTGQDPDSGMLVLKGRVPEAAMEYVRRMRDVKYYETIMVLLARQYEMAQLDEAREGATIQVADPAVPPDRKSSPYRAVIVILSTLIAFIVACLWCRFDDRLDKMKQDPAGRSRIEALRAALRRRDWLTKS